MKTNIECKIYYAHSKQIYGTTREAEELEFIERQHQDAIVINPRDLGELKSYRKYLKIVSKCNLVVVSEYNGFIGKGVLAEIARAFSNDIPVKVIRAVAETLCRCQMYQVWR